MFITDLLKQFNFQRLVLTMHLELIRKYFQISMNVFVLELDNKHFLRATIFKFQIQKIFLVR